MNNGAVSFTIVDRLQHDNRQLADRVSVLEIELSKIKQLIADRLSLMEKEQHID